MPRIDPFEKFADAYQEWFLRHPHAYRAELEAIRRLWPEGAAGMEVGVGAGHFAAALGIRIGVDPSARMRRLAASRGIRVLDGAAEALPFGDGVFDAVLMVTTLCFVDDPDRAVEEIRRVLRPGGVVVVGLVDADSPLGREYRARRHRSRFYAAARFFTVSEVAGLLVRHGFVNLALCQTLFTHPGRMDRPDPVREGHGQGAFVVIRGQREEADA
ncbi:MAG TPA: class I SAM-dependent methyltransferase [Kiritimatiellae bacterium]|nr:class I SAM-dependent methyltransferase [Kiritimatiellia bacterium]